MERLQEVLKSSRECRERIELLLSTSDFLSKTSENFE